MPEQTQLFGDRFTPLYRDSRIQVYTNSAGEIYIKDLGEGVSMTFHSSDRGLEFVTEGLVEPIRIKNGIGWRISRRR